MKLLVILLSVGSFLLYQGASGVEANRVSVMEGDSVTLNTDVVKTQQDKIKWYFINTRIAQISGNLSKTCTDVQCNKDNQRFRDRLKLDHQTGSLTIMNIRNTDSGEYVLQINRNENIFSVSVHGVSAAEREEVKSKEGESFTLDPGVIKNPNDVMIWYHNNTPIAEMTGDQSKICTDVQCKERFRDRLKLDHHTGSLNITNTRHTDSGLYRLSKHITISSSSSSSSRRRRRSINNNAKRFEVTVIGSGPSSSDPGSGLPPAAVAGIVGGVVLLVAAAAFVINNRFRKGMLFKAVRAEDQPRASV